MAAILGGECEQRQTRDNAQPDDVGHLVGGLADGFVAPRSPDQSTPMVEAGVGMVGRDAHCPNPYRQSHEWTAPAEFGFAISK
jgi:hypothetical protein